MLVVFPIEPADGFPSRIVIIAVIALRFLAWLRVHLFLDEILDRIYIVHALTLRSFPQPNRCIHNAAAIQLDPREHFTSKIIGNGIAHGG